MESTWSIDRFVLPKTAGPKEINVKMAEISYLTHAIISITRTPEGEIEVWWRRYHPETKDDKPKKS